MPQGLPPHAQFVLIPHLCDTVCAHLSPSDIAQCIRVCESWCEVFKPYLWTHLDLSDYQLFHRFITSAVIPDNDDPTNEVLQKYSKDLEEQDLPPSTSLHSLASNLKARAIRTGSPLAWMEYSYCLAMPQSISTTLGDDHNQSLLHLLRVPHGTIRNSFLIRSLQVEFHSRLAPCSIVGPHSDDNSMMVSDAVYSTVPSLLPMLVPGCNKLTSTTKTTTAHFHQYESSGKNVGLEMGVSQEQQSSLSSLPASHQQSAFMSFLSQCENLVRLSLVCVGSEAVAENLAFYCPVLEELELKCHRKSGATAMTGGRGEKGSNNYNFHCSDRAIARLILSATSFAGLDTDLDTMAFMQQGASPQRQLKKFAVDNVDRFGQKCVEALVQAHPRLEHLAIKNCESVKSDHWHLLLSSLTCLKEADFQSEGEQGAHNKSARAQTGLREWKSGILQFIPVVPLESLLLSEKCGSASRPLNLNLASLSKSMWICGATLRVLKLGIANFSYSYPQEILPLLDQDGPSLEAKGMYTWLFSHLAGLELLQELWLSDHILDHEHRRRTPHHGVGGLQHESVMGSVTFHLTLEAGLDMLAGLKQLRVLDVRELDHQIGLSEVEWMVANWPGLAILRGLVSTVWLSHRLGYNEKLAAERAARAINWISQCHPHIQIE